MNKKIGFIGLGLMGVPMVKNLLKAGFPVMVYARTSGRAEELVKLGATQAPTPADLGRNCNVVLSIVTGPADVREVTLGKDGVATDPHKDLIVVDMSTIGPTAAREIARDLSQRGVRFADAPITGGVIRATSGELTIFIGAPLSVFEAIQPILAVMGKSLNHMGPVGMGQSIKLVNNYFVAVEAVVLAEGMMLADKMGLDRMRAAEVLQNASTGMSPIMQLVIKNHATGKYPVIFSLSNMRKDVSLAHQELDGLQLPLMEIVKKIFDQGVDAGLSHEDFSKIIQIVEKEDK